MVVGLSKDLKSFKPFSDSADHFAKNHVKIGPEVFEFWSQTYVTVYFYKMRSILDVRFIRARHLSSILIV